MLATLEHMLLLDATKFEEALGQVANLLAQALDADKVDVFLYYSDNQSLIALGTSDTPMGHHQHAIGLDHLPAANGGIAVEVFTRGEPYLTGRADLDPTELRGIVEGLGVRSVIATPFDVAGSRRGVLMATAATEDFFAEDDLRFLQAAARWLGSVVHRTELVERLAEQAAQRARQHAADELITILAHDLRNYMTPLKNRIDLIRRRASREGRQRDVSDADEAAAALNRLSRLISDLLDVGRLEEGIFSLNLQPVDLRALLIELGTTLETQRCRIEVSAPARLIVQADPDRLRQAFENVVSNAVRYSPEAAPVRIDAEAENRDGRDWAVVTVADRGPGIDPAILPRIFDRFAAGPESTGLGLGLHLAARITEAHGGGIEVKTQLGQGACFRFRLPVDGPSTAATGAA